MTHDAVMRLLQLAVDAGAIPTGNVFPKQPREIPAFPALVARRRRARSVLRSEGGRPIRATVHVDLVVVTGNVGEETPAGRAALSAAADAALAAVIGAVADPDEWPWDFDEFDTYESLWGARPVWVSTLPVRKDVTFP